MVVEIKLPGGFVTVVDDEDADLALIRWGVRRPTNRSRQHYVRRSVRDPKDPKKQRLVFLHRVILARKLGRDLLPGETTDHVDEDGLNNRRSNLRPATNVEQHRNISQVSRNTSGFRGVRLQNKTGKWESFICIEGKQVHLGTFSDREDAITARITAEKTHYGEFAPSSREQA